MGSIPALHRFTEFVSFLLSWLFDKETIWKFFIFNDFVNLLQGFLIFVALVTNSH